MAGIVMGASMLLPFAASAAVTAQSFGFKVNDQFNASVNPGSTVDITSAWDVTGGDQIEYIRTRAYNTNGDIVAEGCESVGTVADANDRSLTVPLKLASDQPEGNLTIKQLAFGDPSNARSPGCDTNFDYTPETVHSGFLFVDDSQGNVNDNAGNSGSGGTGGTGGGTSFCDTGCQIKNLQDLIASLTSTVASLAQAVLPKAACIQAPWGNTSALQTFLMSPAGGQAAVFNGQGVYSATGFYGPITTQAVANFKSANNCN